MQMEGLGSVLDLSVILGTCDLIRLLGDKLK